jgi:hypothetical protein
MAAGLLPRFDNFFHLFRIGIWGTFALGLAYGAIRVVILVLKFRGSGDWPTVDGKTIGPGQVKTSYSDRSADYDAEITYEYEVSGTSYRGSHRLKSFKQKQQAEDFLLEHMPESTAVVVHYKPEDPGTSMLELDPYEFDDDEPISLNLEQKK